SRHQRWRDAVAELVALQGEYAQWFEALPEPFRDTATGEALQAILDLDLDEIGAIEPPRGFAPCQAEPIPAITRLAPERPQAPPAPRSARLATVAARCAGPSHGLRDGPLPPKPQCQSGGPVLNVAKGPVPSVA